MTDKKVEILKDDLDKDEKLQFTFWLQGQHEKDKLIELAERNDRSMASMIRQLILKGYKDLKENGD